MGTIRPGTPRENKRGEFWREVCTCGWVGRWWRGHYNAVYRTAPLQTWKHRKERYGYYADEAATQEPERTKKMSDEKIRIRVEVSQWVEYNIDAEYFAYEGGETPDELWETVVRVYSDAPELAWDVTDGENWFVKIKRIGTDDFLHKAHLQPGELLPGDDDE